MKIDFSAKIVLKGYPDSYDLATVAARALAEFPVDETGRQRKISLDESVKRGRLSLRVAEGGEHDLKSEEIALIKDSLPQVWKPPIVARAVDLLDPIAS